MVNNMQDELNVKERTFNVPRDPSKLNARPRSRNRSYASASGSSRSATNPHAFHQVLRNITLYNTIRKRSKIFLDRNVKECAGFSLIGSSNINSSNSFNQSHNPSTTSLHSPSIKYTSATSLINPVTPSQALLTASSVSSSSSSDDLATLTNGDPQPSRPNDWSDGSFSRPPFSLRDFISEAYNNPTALMSLSQLETIFRHLDPVLHIRFGMLRVANDCNGGRSLQFSTTTTTSSPKAHNTNAPDPSSPIPLIQRFNPSLRAPYFDVPCWVELRIVEKSHTTNSSSHTSQYLAEPLYISRQPAKFLAYRLDSSNEADFTYDLQVNHTFNIRRFNIATCTRPQSSGLPSEWNLGFDGASCQLEVSFKFSCLSDAKAVLPTLFPNNVSLSQIVEDEFLCRLRGKLSQLPNYSIPNSSKNFKYTENSMFKLYNFLEIVPLFCVQQVQQAQNVSKYGNGVSFTPPLISIVYSTFCLPVDMCWRVSRLSVLETFNRALSQTYASWGVSCRSFFENYVKLNQILTPTSHISSQDCSNDQTKQQSNLTSLLLLPLIQRFAEHDESTRTEFSLLSQLAETFSERTGAIDLHRTIRQPNDSSPTLKSTNSVTKTRQSSLVIRFSFVEDPHSRNFDVQGPVCPLCSNRYFGTVDYLRFHIQSVHFLFKLITLPSDTGTNNTVNAVNRDNSLVHMRLALRTSTTGMRDLPLPLLYLNFSYVKVAANSEPVKPVKKLPPVACKSGIRSSSETVVGLVKATKSAPASQINGIPLSTKQTIVGSTLSCVKSNGDVSVKDKKVPRLDERVGHAKKSAVEFPIPTNRPQRNITSSVKINGENKTWPLDQAQDTNLRWDKSRRFKVPKIRPGVVLLHNLSRQLVHEGEEFSESDDDWAVHLYGEDPWTGLVSQPRFTHCQAERKTTNRETLDDFNASLELSACESKLRWTNLPAGFTTDNLLALQQPVTLPPHIVYVNAHPTLPARRTPGKPVNSMLKRRKLSHLQLSFMRKWDRYFSRERLTCTAHLSGAVKRFVKRSADFLRGLENIDGLRISLPASPPPQVNCTPASIAISPLSGVDSVSLPSQDMLKIFFAKCKHLCYHRKLSPATVKWCREYLNSHSLPPPVQPLPLPSPPPLPSSLPLPLLLPLLPPVSTTLASTSTTTSAAPSFAFPLAATSTPHQHLPSR